MRFSFTAFRERINRILASSHAAKPVWHAQYSMLGYLSKDITGAVVSLGVNRSGRRLYPRRRPGTGDYNARPSTLVSLGEQLLVR